MKLTDKIFVPLGLAVTTIGGGAFWAATLSSRVDANTVREDRLEAVVARGIERLVEISQTINTRVSRIEGKLDSLKNERTNYGD